MGKSLSCRLHVRLLPSTGLAPGSLQRKDTLLCRRRHAKGPLPLVGVSRIDLDEAETASAQKVGLIGYQISTGNQRAGETGHFAKMPCKGKPAPVGERFEPDANWRKAVTCHHGNVR